jgi:hypothetical protein
MGGKCSGPLGPLGFGREEGGARKTAIKPEILPSLPQKGSKILQLTLKLLHFIPLWELDVESSNPSAPTGLPL